MGTTKFLQDSTTVDSGPSGYPIAIGNQRSRPGGTCERSGAGWAIQSTVLVDAVQAWESSPESSDAGARSQLAAEQKGKNSHCKRSPKGQPEWSAY
jgi:hypothetical protein